MGEQLADNVACAFKECNELRQSLADSERRNELLLGLLREVQKAARKQAWAHGYPTLFERVDACLDKVGELNK